MENDDRPAVKKASARRRITINRKHVFLAVWLPIWVLIGYVAASLLVFGGMYASVQIGLISPLDLSSPFVSAISAALLYLLSAAIVIGVPVVVKKSRTSLKELGLDRLPNWQDILLAPAAFVLYIFLAGILLQLAAQLLPGFDPEQAQDIPFQDLHLGYETALAFLTLVVIAPVAEEILMRGYLYGKLRKIAPMAVAMILTSILFGILHGQWNVGIDVFALSLVMVSLREVTGSIWAAILLHMIKNGIAFYILFINPSILNTIGM